MPHISKLIALLAFFVLFQSAPANAVSGINHNNQVKLEPLKFLFVGNSMTNRNDLPGTFKRYVETSYPGMQIDVAMLAPDGETLGGHKNSGAVAAKIMAMRPNYLILQPGAEILAGYQIDDAPRVLKEPTDFFDAAAFFIEQANAVSAVPVLFSYQLNRAAMTIDVGFIDYPFARAAAHPGTKLVNAGIMISDLPASLRPSLIAADGMHPSPIGTAAGAIAIAQTLFGAPPLTTMTAKTQFNLAREITPEIYMQLNASAQKMLSDRVQALPQRPIYA